MAFELFPDELRPSGGNFIREVLFSSIHLGKRVCKRRCNFFSLSLSFSFPFLSSSSSSFFSSLSLFSTRLIRLPSIYSPTAEHPLNFGSETRGKKYWGMPGWLRWWCRADCNLISKNELQIHAISKRVLSFFLSFFFEKCASWIGTSRVKEMLNLQYK